MGWLGIKLQFRFDSLCSSLPWAPLLRLRLTPQFPSSRTVTHLKIKQKHLKLKENHVVFMESERESSGYSLGIFSSTLYFKRGYSRVKFDTVI